MRVYFWLTAATAASALAETVGFSALVDDLHCWPPTTPGRASTRWW